MTYVPSIALNDDDELTASVRRALGVATNERLVGHIPPVVPAGAMRISEAAAQQRIADQTPPADERPQTTRNQSLKAALAAAIANDGTTEENE